MAKAKKGKKKRPGAGRVAPAKRAQVPVPGSAKPSAAAGPPTAGPKPKPQRNKAQPNRAQRIEAARRANRRKSLMVRLAVAGIAGALVVGALIKLLAGGGGGGGDDPVRAQLTAGSCTYDTKADRTDIASRSHVADPRYKVEPPAGGNHTPDAARPAVHGAGQVPSDGQVVHAMEHGDVVLWHRPDLTPEERGALQKVFGTYERDVLVVPRPQLSSKVAATAWGRRLLCGELEPAALDLFTRTYRDQGPEKLPE